MKTTLTSIRDNQDRGKVDDLAKPKQVSGAADFELIIWLVIKDYGQKGAT